MIAVGLLSMLTGVVLGMHFRVFVLVPATVLACAVIAAFGIVGRDTFWWPAIVMMVAAASLQAGYLVGTARALSADARTPRLRAASRTRAARSTIHAIISD